MSRRPEATEIGSVAWQRVEELFHRALEVPADERRAFVERACGGDEALRQAVEPLLRSADDGEGGDESEDDFLRRVVGGGAVLLEPPRERRIGPYRLLRRLGAGGMGEVFLAERADREYRQQVALKLVRPGLDSARIVERFRRERQILAQLEHPHIARLLDGGTTGDGMPYFVMEHIEGEPIDRYCDRHRLDLPARLELLRTVCLAVFFAHQNLVVHRDLKPSNILITEDGTVKLLDFGIAKLLAVGDQLADAELTLTSERPLTLGYASPEQIRGGPITTASDVYALGCLAYLLLAGRRPFELGGAGRREAERVILEQAPRAPSAAIIRLQRRDSAAAEEVAAARRSRPEALGRRLAGELDAIVLHTLRKQPRRRPGSAAELAEDLRRYLTGLPVRAHRDTLGYRAWKFARRNGVPLALAAVFLLLVAGAWWNSVRQARQVAAERDKALVVVEFLVDLFAVSDPSRSRGETVTARQLLDEGARDVERRLTGQPLVQATLSETIGRVYRRLGLHKSARPLVYRALKVRQEELGDDHPDIAWSLNELGLVEHAAGNYETAEELQRQALEIFHRRGEHSGVAEISNDLALTLNSLDRYDEAEALLRRALELYRSRHGGQHPSIARASANLAPVLAAQGRYQEAQELTREALAVARRLYSEPHPEIARYLNNLASQLHDVDDFAAAESLYREALEMRRQLFEPGHPEILETLNNQGTMAYDSGAYEEAEAAFLQAAEEVGESLGEDHPQVADYVNNLAIAIQAQGDYRQAETLFRRVLEIRRRALGEDSPAFAESLESVATALLSLGDYRQAEPLYQQALGVYLEAFGEGHPWVAHITANLARLERLRGDLPAAVALQRRALERRRSIYGEEHRNVARDRAKLAEMHAAAGEAETALALFRQAVDELRRLAGKEHPWLAAALTGLGAVLADRGELAEAETVLREALAIRRASLPGDHWRIGETESVLGGCLAAAGRRAEAEPLLHRGHAQLEAKRGADHYATRAARVRLDAF